MRIAGLSYTEINKQLGIPKSTLSVWFKDLVLSDSARRRLRSRIRMGVIDGLVRRNKLQTHIAQKRAAETRREARDEIKMLNKNDLMMIGSVLYWAEGYKKMKRVQGKERTSHAISFVNADRKMIHVFARFLKEVLDVPEQKIRACMRLYAHINERSALQHWMHATNLPKSCFRRATYLVTGASKYRRPYNRLPFGTLQIEVADTQKFHRLMGWIEGIEEKLGCDSISRLPG